MITRPDILGPLSKLDGLCPAGYAIALHISYTTPRFLFQTYKKDWREYYSKNGLVMKDPTVRWGFENSGCISWSTLETDDSQSVLKIAKQFGIDHGFTYSTDAGGSKSISSFARSDRDFNDTEIAEICALADEMHKLTAEIKDVSSKAREELKKISVDFTHN